MRPAIAAVLVVICCGLSPAHAAPSDCTVDLQKQLVIEPAQRPDAFQLYTDFYLCLGRSEFEARGLAALREQLARGAEAYVAGNLAPGAYRAFIVDRQRKADSMRRSQAWAEAVGRGDADGDLIPNSADRCPNTAPLTPTDDRGCPLVCPPQLVEGTLVPGADPACVAAAPIPGHAQDPLQPLLDASIPINLSCEDVAPASSALIAWGERKTVVENGEVFHFKSKTKRGYYVSVRRTSSQAKGCEVWYAVEFAVGNPASVSGPSFNVVSVLFSSAEDETSSEPIARFPLVFEQERAIGDAVYTDTVPLSAGRARLRDGLRQFSDVAIRVRVITGAQQSSGWSAYVRQPRGTAVDETTVDPNYDGR